MLTDEQFTAIEQAADAATDPTLPCTCQSQHPDDPSGCPRCDAWIAAYEAERVQAAYEHTLDQAAALNLAQLKPSAR